MSPTSQARLALELVETAHIYFEKLFSVSFLSLLLLFVNFSFDHRVIQIKWDTNFIAIPNNYLDFSLKSDIYSDYPLYFGSPCNLFTFFETHTENSMELFCEMRITFFQKNVLCDKRIT